MRAVVQRVASASVAVIEGAERRESGRIEKGFLILLAARTDDTEEDARWLADKIVGLRVFEDEAGKINLALRDVGGSVLVVSNFTLYGDCRKGRRPGFSEAASGDRARALYERFGELLEKQGIAAAYGEFGAEMQVSLVNDGPVTLIIDSPK